MTKTNLFEGMGRQSIPFDQAKVIFCNADLQRHEFQGETIGYSCRDPITVGARLEDRSLRALCATFYSQVIALATLAMNGQAKAEMAWFIEGRIEDRDNAA